MDGFNTRGTYPVQLFATRGYVVLEPNYRGSQGRGVAFGKADQKDLGGKEFEDVIAGIDHLAAQGLIDPQRVGMAPGAASSTSGPVAEKQARLSVESVAATAMTESNLAG